MSETCDCKKLGKGKMIRRRFLCDHNNLKAMYPHLIPEWHEDNEPMENYTCCSGVKVKWKCSNENICECHIWEASPHKRTRKDRKPTGCPYCNNNKPCEHNNLQVKHQELINEWHPDNKPMTDYLPKSHATVLWKCSKENICECHIWEASINNRTGTKKSGCPFCDGAPCKHNNLKTCFPELENEWSSENNDMSLYSYGSSKEVFWVCSNNPDHRWSAIIKSRTGKDKNGCPFCKPVKYSKAEIAWINEIEERERITIRNAKSPKGQFKIDGIGFVDGYCEQNNTCYEFNGDFWHGNPSLFNRNDINSMNNKTYGELYDKTVQRENKIRALGYNLIVKWETDFDESNIINKKEINDSQNQLPILFDAGTIKKVIYNPKFRIKPLINSNF